MNKIGKGIAAGALALGASFLLQPAAEAATWHDVGNYGSSAECQSAANNFWKGYRTQCRLATGAGTDLYALY
ncbi:hypothetical protein [Amycolatopsis sp. NPDC004378]